MILRNRIQCIKCGDIVNSYHRHHFVMCNCGAVGVDGGLEYLRRTGTDWVELSRIIEGYDVYDAESSKILLDDYEEWITQFPEGEPYRKTLHELFLPRWRGRINWLIEQAVELERIQKRKRLPLWKRLASLFSNCNKY